MAFHFVSIKAMRTKGEPRKKAIYFSAFLINTKGSSSVRKEVRETSIVEHSVSKVHFWSKKYKFLISLKNGQFLFLCQKWLFSKYLNFRAKIGQKLSFYGFIFGNFWSKSQFLVKIAIFGLKVLIFDTF